jgi:hypothetical protein
MEQTNDKQSENRIIRDLQRELRKLAKSEGLAVPYLEITVGIDRTQVVHGKPLLRVELLTRELKKSDKQHP